MPDFNEHTKVNELLNKAQEVEHDNREAAREAHHFVDKRDGQWEPDIIQVMTNRPRYTFDKVGPIVDQITGEIDQADFDIRIRPAGGDATKETASIYDGIIRNIESMSNAQHIYAQAAREVVVSGLGGWMVKQDYVDGDSFEQDLIIQPLNNYEDRVFFDPGAEMQDQSDAGYVFVLTPLSKDEYDKRWPEGSGASISEDRDASVYYYKKEEVVVGQIFYKKPTEKELVLFSDGSVREATDDLEKILDELKEGGVTEVQRRTRKTTKVMSRIFDGADWLTEEQETVFDEYLPVIPAFANFHIREGKIIYHGAVLRLIDPQRVYNYTRSRETEEVALAPRAKYWMTRKQSANEEVKLQTLNTNADPVQFFTPDPELPGPPQQQGGAQQNPGLAMAGQNSSRDLTEAAGLFGLNQGDAEGNTLSGVAIQSLQNKGDNATIKYFSAMEVAISATAKVLVKAIPKVYDTNRQVRILNEDGSQEIVSVNDRVFDQESGQWVTANDLRKGKYDVTCDVGPAFRNRQQETVKALTEIMVAMPEVGQLGGDILLNNISSPGVDLVAARLRQQLIGTGVIPEDQMTDEEKTAIQQAQLLAQQKPQEPTPEDKIADAEIGRVQAETADIISKSQERQEKTALEMAKINLKAEEQEDKFELDQLKLMMMQQAQSMEQQQAVVTATLQGQQAVFDALNQQAETLKTLREAMGVDTIVGPGNTEAYIQQAEMITEQQEGISDRPLPGGS